MARLLLDCTKLLPATDSLVVAWSVASVPSCINEQWEHEPQEALNLGTLIPGAGIVS